MVYRERSPREIVNEMGERFNSEARRLAVDFIKPYEKGELQHPIRLTSGFGSELFGQVAMAANIRGCFVPTDEEINARALLGVAPSNLRIELGAYTSEATRIVLDYLAEKKVAA
ncbi:hypothetical protein COU60_05140 [Candidatus Pacearchaeota archaeon CG10_big_fil_rev_8_21_14_0_10_34_76]|nr:MAG: hypothetical protein COU60_05140 [Candidatus Pacearchaeota archaeon CG10_big_fil_rev_8_21_14_0_10_34_76]